MKKAINYVNNNMNKFVFILISVLVLNLVFYIFVGSKALINSDSSFVVDYAIEQIETKSLFPKTWINSNDFWIYSLIPIITPFVKLGVNLFVSRQIAVFVQTILFFILLYDFYKKVFEDKKGLLIMMLLFLSGISGQFMYEMYGDATYGTIVFYMLLCLWLFIKYIKSDYSKKKYLIFFSIILALITSCSLRFPIYIGAPLICCIIYFIYEKGIDKKHIIAISAICGAVLVGFLVNKYMQSTLTFINNYSNKNLTDNSETFVYNVGKMAYDYFFVCGATGKNIFSLTLHLNNDFIDGASSPLVVLSFIKYIYAIVTIIIPFVLMKKFKKMSNIEKTLYIYVTSFTVMMIFFLVLGDLAWWHRYIFTVVFCLNLLYPMFYKYFFEKNKKNNCVFKIAFALFVLTSMVFSIGSYVNYKNNYIRRNGYQNLSDYLIKEGYTHGYALDTGETNLFRTITNGKLQVVRLNREGTDFELWLTSTRFLNPNYYHGKTFFIRHKGEDEVELQDYAKEKFTVGNFMVYTFDSNDEVFEYLRSAPKEKTNKVEEKEQNEKE